MYSWIRSNWGTISLFLSMGIFFAVLAVFFPTYFALILKALPTAICWASILLAIYIIGDYIKYRRMK